MNTIDNNMVGVNNFITDLLDGMKAKKVSTLLLTAGGYCIYQKEAGALIASDCDGNHDPAELFEDLAALGFTLKTKQEDYYYRYDPNGKEDPDSMFFIVQTGRTLGSHRASFQLMKENGWMVKRELQEHNPVTTSDYVDYVY